MIFKEQYNVVYLDIVYILKQKSLATHYIYAYLLQKSTLI